MLHALKTRWEKEKGRLLLGLLLCLAGCLLLFFNETSGRVLMHNTLRDTSLELVNDGIQKNLVAFGSVSAIKAAVAVVEGSSVGVGFNLQLGDLIQPAHDYIDFVWKIFLYALVVLMLYKILLETGILLLGVQLAGLGAVLFGLAFLWQHKRIALLLWARRCVLVGFLFAYVVPVALIGADYLGGRYTEPYMQRQREKMTAVRYQFSEAKMQMLNLRESVSVMDPGGSYERVRHSFLQVARRVTDLATEGMSSFVYYVLTLLFELLVLPFVTALLLYWLARLALANPLKKEAPPEN